MARRASDRVREALRTSRDSSAALAARLDEDRRARAGREAERQEAMREADPDGPGCGECGGYLGPGGHHAAPCSVADGTGMAAWCACGGVGGHHEGCEHGG